MLSQEVVGDRMETEQAPAVPGAVEALIAELEREHAWLTDLRADAARVEARCGHLLNAADSALSALDRADRRRFYERLRRLQLDRPTPGRPPRDGRRDAVLQYLAEKGRGQITNAEIRAHLTARGLKGNSAYVGCLLHRLKGEGMLLRSGHGRYTIAHDNDHLRLLRFRLDRRGTIEEERQRLATQDRVFADDVPKGDKIRRLCDVPGLRERLEREALEELRAEREAGIEW